MNFMVNKILTVRRSDSQKSTHTPSTAVTSASVRTTIVAHVWPSDHSSMRDVRFHFYDMEEAKTHMTDIHHILGIYASKIFYNESNHHTQGFVEKLLISLMKRKFQDAGYNIKWIEFH
jgi:hypothetical protein